MLSANKQERQSRQKEAVGSKWFFVRSRSFCALVQVQMSRILSFRQLPMFRPLCWQHSPTSPFWLMFMVSQPMKQRLNRGFILFFQERVLRSSPKFVWISTGFRIRRATILLSSLRSRSPRARCRVAGVVRSILKISNRIPQVRARWSASSIWRKVFLVMTKSTSSFGRPERAWIREKNSIFLIT